MVKILQILGTRPHCVKYIDMSDIFEQRVVWTGQHFSGALNISDEFGIKYDRIFNATGLWEMGTLLSNYLKQEDPACVIIYGDTRSSLAGAMAAFGLGIKIAHVESGVRLEVGDRHEERIRRAIDHVSDYLFAPTITAEDNLLCERVKGQIHVVGDIHYERYLQGREPGDYVLLTLHRQEHVDNKELLEGILNGLPKGARILFPAHPRTASRLKEFTLILPSNIEMVAPYSYGEMQKKIKMAKRIITDSGGLAKEAYFAGTPVSFIGESEWEKDIMTFGDGKTAEKIKRILKKELSYGGTN